MGTPSAGTRPPAGWWVNSERVGDLSCASLGRFGLTGRYTRRTRFVYSTCMARVRTNIEIEDSYLQLVMDRYHLRTKTEAVDLALRHLAGQPMSREEALAMRGSRSIGKASADSRPRGA